ncbi:tRNA pseudouridine synthase B [Candidatus Photodesmus blepharus]|uniref:tRNA pseudouridine synthase B n=1 Tax=Candidatus Photodesmus blepharonis TaxID=1179155 RepID=A0A084CP67_9GAMM|nr:tRNA pseudouridine(55) synthase TruB [Candidatus Photodesmus blepharus]KEY91596.1 tRNA pseudouridine synthase B [Candidatus Photodesmus blepharus]
MKCNATNRKSRPINGIILLDKPMGISSNQALQQVKHIYFAQKAGHAGTLDPLATGMLPIYLGEATKFAQFSLNADKSYVVKAKLGERTNTSDSYGNVIKVREVNITHKQLKCSIASFQGEINQIPSMFSAVKYQGSPLYKYARKGIEVLRKTRKVTVYSIKLLQFKDREIKINIHCSKGTYIRTIVDDLGEMLGCGAHVTYLRRTSISKYPREKMVTLEELNQLFKKVKKKVAPQKLLDFLLIPIDAAVENLPEININKELAQRFQHGTSIQATETESLDRGTIARITSGEERTFIGTATIKNNGQVAPKRLVINTHNRAK